MSYRCSACERTYNARSVVSERALCESLNDTLPVPAAAQQLHLSKFPEGKFCIQLHHKLLIQEPPVRPTLSSPIITLPDELLTEIFSLAVNCESWRPEFYTCALALSATCKLFHRITQPLLFQNIQFRWPHSIVPACGPPRCLYRTLKESPSLGAFCKRVKFHIPSLRLEGMQHEDFVLAEELSGLLPNATAFYLHGGFAYPQTWPFIHSTLRCMPHIKHVSLDREDWDLFLTSVCSIIMNTNLQSLDLGGISRENKDVAWKPDFKGLEGKSTITNLSISDWGETIQSLRYLLKLPAGLKTFRFTDVDSRHDLWDLSVFEMLLEPHHISLETIHIGKLGGWGKSINILSFPNVRTLHLSRWIFDLSPQEAIANFLSPRLHTFIWDFGIYDQHSERWTDFGPQQRDWVIHFAHLAVARKSMMQNIKIVFTPDEYSRPCTWDQLKTWGIPGPWRLMEEARETLRLLGIDLSWNKCEYDTPDLKQIQENEAYEKKLKLDITTTNLPSSNNA